VSDQNQVRNLIANSGDEKSQLPDGWRQCRPVGSRWDRGRRRAGRQAETHHEPPMVMTHRKPGPPPGECQNSTIRVQHSTKEKVHAFV